MNQETEERRLKNTWDLKSRKVLRHHLSFRSDWKLSVTWLCFLYFQVLIQDVGISSTSKTYYIAQLCSISLFSPRRLKDH